MSIAIDRERDRDYMRDAEGERRRDIDKETE